MLKESGVGEHESILLVGGGAQGSTGSWGRRFWCGWNTRTDEGRPVGGAGGGGVRAWHGGRGGGVRAWIRGGAATLGGQWGWRERGGRVQGQRAA